MTRFAKTDYIARIHFFRQCKYFVYLSEDTSRNHVFLKLLVRSMDVTKCSETLFKLKAKVVDSISFEDFKNKVADFMSYFNCLFRAIWSIFTKMGHMYVTHASKKSKAKKILGYLIEYYKV